MEFKIRQGNIDEVVKISRQIPEFINPYPKDTYEARLSGVPHLILIAEYEGKGVGFKVGYDRDKDSSFYSWMGAVLPNYRRAKLAKRMAEYQEAWAKKQGYSSIRFKTRNKLKAMQIFAISRGFDIIGLFPEEELGEYRILMEKQL
ncbi:MAG: GNAT family N-acetyltransferase [Bacteroidota bacterium]